MTSSAADRLTDDALALAYCSPASFAHVVSGGLWVPYEHLILLNDYLLRVTTGEITRLIVTMPPRHGKSELISRYLPAWYLGRFPDRQVILASYGKDLAADHGEKARELLSTWGPRMFGVTVTDQGASRWRVDDHEGVMVSSGLRGGITGRGAHLLIIDDPIKDELEAQSELKRERVWNWWQSTASTRLMPGPSAVIVVQTRWHEDDLAGRLIGESDRWTLLNLPALAEADDELGRDEGEALCHELYDEAQFAAMRAEKGSYFFAAMYQQRPAPAEGIMFKRQHFRYYEVQVVPINAAIDQRLYVLHDDEERRVDAGFCTVFQTCDVAISSRDTADWTVVATWALTPDRDLLLLDVERQRFEEQQIAMFLKRCSDKHGRPPMWVESFGAGRSPLGVLTRDGYPVMALPAEAGTKLDKVTRAFGAVSAYERHGIFHPRNYSEAPWLQAFEEELIPFPNATHDDQVDVVSYAARMVPIVGGPQRRMQQPNGWRPVTGGIMSEMF